MKRRAFLVACLSASLAWGQDVAKRRLGFLGVTSREQFLEGQRDKLLEELARLGHVRGRNLEVEERYSPRSPDELRAFARELAARVDVIVTEGTPATLSAQAATKTVPIVAIVGDPVSAGFARELQRPGGNVTGMSQNRGELARKQMDLVRLLRPGRTRMAMLYFEAQPGAELLLRPMTRAAREASIEVEMVPMRPDAFTAAAEALKKRHVDIAYIAGISSAQRAGAIRDAIHHGIALFVPTDVDVMGGGLAAVEADGAEDYREMAAMVDKLLRGANPATMPFSVATRFRTILNAKTAAALGIRLPPDLLLRVDRVVE